jgi:hypothetical protein
MAKVMRPDRLASVLLAPEARVLRGDVDRPQDVPAALRLPGEGREDEGVCLEAQTLCQECASK